MQGFRVQRFKGAKVQGSEIIGFPHKSKPTQFGKDLLFVICYSRFIRGYGYLD